MNASWLNDSTPGKKVTTAGLEFPGFPTLPVDRPEIGRSGAALLFARHPLDAAALS
jgi:hypothetical protein